MTDEPILFIRQEGATAATGRLLFTPSAAPRIISPDCSVTYVAGTDYLWKQGSDTITLTANSRIPSKTAAEMAPPAGSPNTLFGVLFSEGRFFHDLQVLVSYPHAGTWPSPPAPTLRLTRSLAMLRAKQPVTIVALGDSITEGYNASGMSKVNVAPFQPAFAQLVCDALHERFGSSVSLVNLALAGTKSDWGLTRVARVVESKPDIVILAFGMNDSEDAATFTNQMRQLRDAVVAGCPGADVVLVASMTANPRITPAAHFTAYRDALRGLEMPNVVVADVTTPFIKLLERKAFSDLSGNDVNHPNDFTHRLYADVICQLFPPKATGL